MPDSVEGSSPPARRDSRGGGSADRGTRSGPAAGGGVRRDRAGAKPDRSGGRPSGKRPDRSAGNPFDKRSERGGRERDFEDRDPYGVKSVRNRHDDPPLPDDVQPKDLDRVARTQLKTLSKENADEVARHLAMAARVIDEDPALAHRHATSAARRAGRIAVVRETLAITAYSIGDFALALRELRTYRRISGLDDQLPMMVDSERGLGRPDKALELGRSVPRDGLPPEVQAELAIAMSGARLDLGQLDQALGELETSRIDPDTAFPWSPALFDAYAAVLEELGRSEDAELWFDRADRARGALDAAAGRTEDETVEIVEEEVLEEEIPEEDIPEEDVPTDPTDPAPGS